MVWTGTLDVLKVVVYSLRVQSELYFITPTPKRGYLALYISSAFKSKAYHNTPFVLPTSPPPPTSPAPLLVHAARTATASALNALSTR